MPSLHKTVRAAVKTALEAALTAESVTLTVHEQEILDLNLVSLPCAVICYAESESFAGTGLNSRDDWKFPILVGLYTEKEPRASTLGCEVTLFREIVRETFHNKRISGVTGCMLTNVSQAGVVFDIKSAWLKNLQTAMVVTPTVRIART